MRTTLDGLALKHSYSCGNQYAASKITVSVWYAANLSCRGVPAGNQPLI